MLAMQMTQINRTLCYKQSSSISLLKKKCATISAVSMVSDQ